MENKEEASITVYLPREVAAQVKEQARLEDLSVTQYVRRAIRERLDRAGVVPPGYPAHD